MATTKDGRVIDKKIEEITKHETLDVRRKAHAIQTLKELRAALLEPDADYEAIVAGKLAECDQRLADITAKENGIKAENVARAKQNLPALEIPAPDLTLAQRHHTQSVLAAVVNALQ